MSGITPVQGGSHLAGAAAKEPAGENEKTEPVPDSDDKPSAGSRVDVRA
jgi:hypothetical protein